MRMSKAGMVFLAREEGVVLSAYYDSVGVLTIGVGHTSAAGPPKVIAGLELTLDECMQLFAKDLVKYEREVLAAVKVPLSQSQFDALVSFHYNTGAIRSGSIDEKLNDGNIQAALATWRSYNKAGGRVVPGLAARRDREIDLFNGKAPAIKTVPVYEKYPGKARSVSIDTINWGAAPEVPVPPAPPEAPAQEKPWFIVLLEAVLSIFKRS